MTESTYPSEEQIRTALLQRAEEFTRLTGTTRSTIGKEAVNDPAFLSQVAAGRNFTIGLYQRVMAYLDANWPSERAGAA